MENFFKDAGARGFAAPESAKTKAQLRDRPDRRAPASERRRRAFGEGRKELVGSGSCRSTSDAAWRDQANDSGP